MRNLRLLWVAGVRACWIALATVLASALWASAQNRTIIDDLGFRVVVKTNSRRIVSLVPTNSEMVCLLDCERLKGGTRHDEFPLELRRRIGLKQVETVGGGFDANLEKILQLRPDLILTNGPSQQRFAVPLKSLGYAVLSLWPRDLDGLKRDFLLLGELLDQEEKAHSLLRSLEARFQAIATKARDGPRRRVYLQMWSEPLITVGKVSFTDWLVRTAGGVNVFGDLPFDSPQIGLESLIQRNPQVLVFLADQAPMVKTLKHRPGWSAIDGVRAGRYCFIEEPDIRRSIMFVEGLAKLQDCILRSAPIAE